MRGDRLLQLVLELQDGRRRTLASLAARLGSSVRTVVRDLDALSASGAPLVSHRGAQGGISLAPGWKMPVPQLSRAEVQALSTVGSSRALDALDLAGPLRNALRKVASSLPELQRLTAEHARQRLLVDTSGWFEPPDATAALPLLRDACWTDQRIELDYRNLDGTPSRRTVDPLGLVVKGDRWYLVARDGKAVKAFRGSRISSVSVLPERFVRPKGFDLAASWQASVASFREARPSFVVRLRIDDVALQKLVERRPPSERKRLLAARRDRRGFRTISVDFERETIAFETLATIAPGVEVKTPRALRERLFDLGSALTASHVSSAKRSGPHGSRPPAIRETARRSRPVLR